ncbi:MAG: biotin/lipoyl-binding protein [Anaerolineae bacterium]|nr:biotin/lipoyl-binding protein [Anaerolineae bacterium]
MRYEVIVNNQKYTLEVNQEGKITVDGQETLVEFSRIGDSGLYLLLVNNESFEGLVEEHEDLWQVVFRGNLYDVQVNDERAQLMRGRAHMSVPDSGELPVKAPIPGLVINIPVEIGQEVSKGDNLVILESMKMENELKAPRDGRVERINVEVGNSVEQHQTLLVLV